MRGVVGQLGAPLLLGGSARVDPGLRLSYHVSRSLSFDYDDGDSVDEKDDIQADGLYPAGEAKPVRGRGVCLWGIRIKGA